MQEGYVCRQTLTNCMAARFQFQVEQAQHQLVVPQSPCLHQFLVGGQPLALVTNSTVLDRHVTNRLSCIMEAACTS